MSLLYGLRPGKVLQAAVLIMRDQVPAAKSLILSDGEYETPAVSQLLGPCKKSPDEAVLGWLAGLNSYVPPNVDHFFERVFLRDCLDKPEILSFMGFLEQAGIRGHHGYLSDSPSDRHDQLEQQSRRYALGAITAAKWEPEANCCQQLSLRILKWKLENDKSDFRDQIYPLEQLGGMHSMYILLMTDFAPITEEADLDLYVMRLRAVKSKFARLEEDIEKKRLAGVMPPRPCLNKIIRGVRSILDDLSGGKVFISAVERLWKDLSDGKREEIRTATEDAVIPAYNSLLAALNLCLETATDDAGLWKLPRGAEFYERCLIWETTTDLTPEQVHRIGEDQVAKLFSGVQEVVGELNERGDMTLSTENSVEENLRILGENERFLFPDTAEGIADCIGQYRTLLEEVSGRVEGMFNVLPASQCIIKPMPVAMGEGGAGACYYPGSVDLVRPGIFYANTTNIKSQNKCQMRTLVAHEAVPGHHFQLSLNQENKDLPYFRRVYTEDEGAFTAYIEGWGLYSEHLGREIGFYKEKDGSNGYSLLGYYMAELMRAARLVVDTGLHYYRWPREKAVDFMKRTTGMTAKEAEDEVDRYCVLPGQACSYKIGQLKLLEIRQKLEKERPDFDLAKFHDRILAIGAIALEQLETEMLTS